MSSSSPSFHYLQQQMVAAEAAAVAAAAAEDAAASVVNATVQPIITTVSTGGGVGGASSSSSSSSVTPALSSSSLAAAVQGGIVLVPTPTTITLPGGSTSAAAAIIAANGTLVTTATPNSGNNNNNNSNVVATVPASTTAPTTTTAVLINPQDIMMDDDDDDSNGGGLVIVTPDHQSSSGAGIPLDQLSSSTASDCRTKSGGGSVSSAMEMAAQHAYAAAIAANGSASGGGGDDGIDCQMEDIELDYYDQEDDYFTKPTMAAVQSRLKPDAMSPEEKLAFPDIPEHLAGNFFYVRNSILQMWYENPKIQLTMEKAFSRLEPQLRALEVSQQRNNRNNGTNCSINTLDNYDAVIRIFQFLERWGYINFGIFTVEKPPTPLQISGITRRPKVIVLGAGVAGLIAARQLKFFGFDVLVLESRNRIGGRVNTYKNGKHIADVGAMIITGLGGNPIRVLQRQIDMPMQRINQKCPLFYGNQMIEKYRDEILESVFNTLLEGTTIMAHKLKFREINGRPLSLGESLDIVLELQEREIKQAYLKHLTEINALEEALGKNLQEKSRLTVLTDELYSKHEEYCRSKQQRPPTQEYAFRRNRLDLLQAIKLFKKCKSNIKRIETKLAELQKKEIPHAYLSVADRRILDWHFANLEFACATKLDNLSLTYWDQDDEHEFTGPQIMLKNGYSTMPFALAEGVEVKLNCVCRQVKLTPTGVEVTAVQLDAKYNQQCFDNRGLERKVNNSPQTVYTADAVLCTLPLGVLKNSIGSDPAESSASENAPPEPPNGSSGGSGGGGNGSGTSANNSSTRQSQSSATASSSSTTTSTPSPWQQSPNRIEFIPPLPEKKRRSIARLGYGNLNKVILIFDHKFWDKNTHLFGHVAGNTEARGELFLFWSVYKHPVLMALIAGESADRMEKVEDEEIKDKCLQILHGIFPKMNATLKNYYVSRWRADPWSLGAYSYVSPGTTGNDYEVIGEAVGLAPTPPDTPVSATTTSSSSVATSTSFAKDQSSSSSSTVMYHRDYHHRPYPPEVAVESFTASTSSTTSATTSKPRLFFAGEHTTRSHPSTVHGAMMTGLREAGKIANEFFGNYYNTKPPVEEEPKELRRPRSTRKSASQQQLGGGASGGGGIGSGVGANIGANHHHPQQAHHHHHHHHHPSNSGGAGAGAGAGGEQSWTPYSIMGPIMMK